MWFGEPRFMTQHPDPDPGIPLTPIRRTAEHDLAGGGRVIDVIGRPRREYRLTWSGLTAQETGDLEQYADGSRGRGPFHLLLDGAHGWNYLPGPVAATGSATGDTTGWAAETPTTLTTVDRFTTNLSRGPRALQWAVAAEAAFTRYLFQQWPGDQPQLGTGVPWTFTVNARTVAGTVSMFAQISSSLGTGTGGDTIVGTTDWAQLTVTYTPTFGTIGSVNIGKRPGPAADIIIDTPRLTVGPAVQPWTPGRGIPPVSIVDAAVLARWHDLYDVAITVREVD